MDAAARNCVTAGASAGSRAGAGPRGRAAGGTGEVRLGKGKASVRGADEGSSTVIGVATASLAVLLAFAVGAVGLGLRAKAQAEAAADLAAIAAVQAISSGGDAPCDAAGSVAERNGAVVSDCLVRPDLQRSRVEVEVPVALRLPGWERSIVMTAEAVAGHAGPR